MPVANGALQLSSQPLLGQLVWWQVFKHWWGQEKKLQSAQMRLIPYILPMCLGLVVGLDLCCGPSDIISALNWRY